MYHTGNPVSLCQVLPSCMIPSRCPRHCLVAFCPGALVDSFMPSMQRLWRFWVLLPSCSAWASPQACAAWLGPPSATKQQSSAPCMQKQASLLNLCIASPPQKSSSFGTGTYQAEHVVAYLSSHLRLAIEIRILTCMHAARTRTGRPVRLRWFTTVGEAREARVGALP
jgi:hypothetical protein